MIKLRESLLLFGLVTGLGCQHTPTQSEATPTEPDRVQAATPSAEANPTTASSSDRAVAAPVRKQRTMAKATPPAAVVNGSEKSRSFTPVSTKYTLPAESEVSVRLIDSISTETNEAGDTFLASLAEPLMVNGMTLFPKDTSVSGKIITLTEPGRVSGVASISLKLTEIQPKKGNPVSLETQPLSETAKAEKKKDAAIIGGGAAIGTVIGAIAGGKKGAAIGAIAGGGGSTGYVLATKGKQLKYPSETLMTFKLAEPLTVIR